ncbi:hypothetical protein Vafri_7071 [Volvox africanus]|uniref:OCRE domain-containing protein n=1 Tax=Volvox africanus TaxID=51714 RepID=A0A8J4AZH2_9CHLO|nr:hypothetical protein Vafri_7071 [Volvox africanus]
MQLLEDTSMPDDLAAAEEDYDEPDALYNEDGIPIEPFHLRAEREAGYFDAEGNYLEYRLAAEDTDAWLESIMDEHHQVRADPELVARRRRAAATAAAGLGSEAMGVGAALAGGPAAAAAAGTIAGGMNTSKGRRQRRNAIMDESTADMVTVGDAPVDEEEEEEEDGPYDMHMLDDTGDELEDDERAVYQKRVADLLQPGETPLDGLRRLGKVMHGGAAAAGIAAASAATAAAGPPAVAADAGVATDNEGGGTVGVGGGGRNAAVADDAVPLLNAPVGAAPAGLGSVAPVGGGGGSGDGGHDDGGGGSGSMVQLTCGERQRLRKQRREHQGMAEGTALADPPPPPPPSPSQHRQQPQDEAGEAGKGELVAAAAELLERSHVKKDVKGGKEISEEEERGRRAQSGGDVDMEELDGSGAAASEPLLESRSAGLRPADAPPSPAARQSVAEATAAAAARRRAPTAQPSEAVREARRQFDSLTSYANLLLSAGMYDVYSSTREQLLRAAQRTLGVDVVRSLTVAGLQPIGRVAAPGRATTLKRPVSSGRDAMAAEAGGADNGGGGGATLKRKRLDMNFMEGMIGPHDVGKEDEFVEGGDGAVTGFDAANTTRATTSGPGGSVGATRMNAVDMDVDMFGDDDDDWGSGGGSAPQAAACPGSGSAAVDETDRPRTMAADSAAAAEAAAAASAGVRGAAAAGTTAMEAQGRQLEAASGGDVDAAAGPSGTLPDRDGFEVDPDSGYLYSSKVGYYYDIATGLYGDANTGLWYRYIAAEGPGATGGDDGGLGSSVGGGWGGAGGGGGAKPGGRFELATMAVTEQQQLVPEQEQKQDQIGQADG